jgi:hypothetical protein
MSDSVCEIQKTQMKAAIISDDNIGFDFNTEW